MGGMRVRWLAVAGVAMALSASGCGAPTSGARSPEIAATAVSAPVSVAPELVEQVTEAYRAYLADHARALERLTRDFADAVRAGEDDKARELYLEARREWHLIRPAALAATDLAMALDAQSTELGALEEWTGWHRFEAELWGASGHEALSSTERDRLAELLERDTEVLVAQLTDPNTAFPPHAIAAHASQLIESALGSSLVGTAESLSGANMLVAQAQVDGARARIETLAPLVEDRDPMALDVILGRLEQLEYVLAHGTGDLEPPTEDDALVLIRAAEALAEPLSRLPAVVVDR